MFKSHYKLDDRVLFHVDLITVMWLLFLVLAVVKVESYSNYPITVFIAIFTNAIAISMACILLLRTKLLEHCEVYPDYRVSKMKKLIDDLKKLDDGCNRHNLGVVKDTLRGDL